MHTNSQEKTGDCGNSLNFSQGGRSLNFAGDKERILRYDPYVAITKKQMARHFIRMLIWLAATVALIVVDHPWWSLLPGLGFLFQLSLSIQTAHIKPGTAYEKGLLVPAMVISTHPICLMVMASVSTKDRIVWGLKSYMVTDLPDVPIEVGTRIPCSALLGGIKPFAGLWTQLEPHPLAWATDDISIIEAAIAAIDAREWETLEKLARMACEIELSRTGTKKQDLVCFNEEGVECVPPDMLPVTILKKVCWRFNGGVFDSYPAFIEEVMRYQEEIGIVWDPDAVVLGHSEIRVHVCFWEQHKEQEMLLTLQADDKKSFTAGELLYKIHNATVSRLENTDTPTLQGLELYRGKNRSGVPLYELGLAG